MSFMLMFHGCAREPGTAPDANGLIRLADDAFQHNQPIAIAGPVDFYWDRLIDPSEKLDSPTARLDSIAPWNLISIAGQTFPARGKATYVIKLFLPGARQKLTMAMPYQFSAVRVFANEKLIAESGKIGRSLEETVSARDDLIIPLETDGGYTTLLFHVANAEFVRGGMRGRLVLGKEEDVKRYILQKQLLDFMTIGLILGSGLYHLCFYLLHRSQKAFLVFAVLCFLIAFRIPLFASKVHTILIPGLSYEAQVRLTATFNFWMIAPAILYFRVLFPDLISRRTTWIYLSGIILATLTHFMGMRVLSTVNWFWAIAAPGTYFIHSIFILARAIREKRPAVLMAVGIGSLAIFLAIARIQTIRGDAGGNFALLSFFLFVLFQALALSRFFQAAVEGEARLTERLHDSNLALVRQRSELQVNLHDSLGGALTDLQVHAEKRMETANGEEATTLQAMHHRITDTVKMFRSQLLFMEDLEMTVSNLLPGIQMTLLRRYADAGREMDFDVPDETLRRFETDHDLLPVSSALEIFFLVTELCTNDLKYGQGESRWRIYANANALYIEQTNRIKDIQNVPSEPRRVRERIENLVGHLSAKSVADSFYLKITIPFRKSGSKKAVLK